MDRRNFLKTAGAGSAFLSLAGSSLFSATSNKEVKPNFIIIFCDDLGYGDLGVFGHPTIRTPNLDRMAHEGQKWTNFYAAASVCTPSRAGIMTGRLPIRSGMCDDNRRVLFTDSAGGLPQSEITIARALKNAGYATACIGKWHLGHLPQYLPTQHGFDSYFGIPYSNDMNCIAEKKREAFLNPKIEDWNGYLMRNTEIIERPVNQHTLTKRYTEETIRYIKSRKDNPFFIYLAHNLPHVPLFVSEKFEDKSLRGLYGDVVEEIDWGVGQILKTLKDEGIDKNTLVVFTSDNGPWLSFNEQGGSAGPLREGKGCTFEGGMREPTIFWWPGTIKPGLINDMGCTMELFPTFCRLAGAEIPADRVMDGFNICPTLLEAKPSPRDLMFYYRGTQIFAVRKGRYKAHFHTQIAYIGDPTKYSHEPPLLYDLGADPGEKYNIADKHPEIIADLRREVEKHQANLVPGENQLVKRIGQN